MKQSMHVLEGLVTLDGYLSPDTAVLLSPHELVLRHPSAGAKFSIPTASSPEPGRKVIARCSLEAVLASPLVRTVKAAGGVLNVGTALAKRLRGSRTGGEVHLFNSGKDFPDLARACQEAGVVCHSIGHQESPRSLIVQLPRDRLIVKEAPAVLPSSLEAPQLESVDRIVSEASDVASVSSKDAALAAATTSMCNGARRVFQPTGALSPEMTLLLASQAHEVVCNLDEWALIGKWAGLPLPGQGEDSPEAPEAAAHLLRTLRRRRWAGLEAAACTLGRRGSVVADWQQDRVWFIALAMTGGSDPGIATLAGTGDMFLAEWIFWRAWYKPGNYRHPIAAAAKRVTCAVASILGLRQDRYEVREISL